MRVLRCVLFVLLPCIVVAKSAFFPDVFGNTTASFFAQFRIVFLYFALLLLFFTSLLNLIKKPLVNVFLYLGLLLLFFFLIIASVFVSANPSNAKMIFLSNISMFVSLGVFLSVLPCFVMSICIHFENREYFFELSGAKKVANSALSFFIGIGIAVIGFGLAMLLSEIGIDLSQENIARRFDNIYVCVMLSLFVFIGILYVIYKESTSFASRSGVQRVFFFLQHGLLTLIAVLAINLVMRYLL